MLRTRFFALGILTCGGCLGPLADDEAGYSPRILSANAKLPSAADDYVFNNRIDENDNVDDGDVSLETGYALGTKVRYWSLGPARSSATPAWQLFYCDGVGAPIVDGPELHPVIVDSLPDDRDYSQFWSLQRICVTERYNGELITSPSALSDAIEIGLVEQDPADVVYVHFPVVTENVTLEGGKSAGATMRTAFYRGTKVPYLDFGKRGKVAEQRGRVATMNVYQVVREGGMQPERIVFTSAPEDAAGGPTDGYTPLVYLATVTVSEDADLSLFNSASDLVMEDEGGQLVPAHETVLSVEVSRDRVAWPIASVEATP